MPNLNDYHAYKSTSGGSGGGMGCSTQFWVVFIIIAVLTTLGECAY